MTSPISQPQSSCIFTVAICVVECDPLADNALCHEAIGKLVQVPALTAVANNGVPGELLTGAIWWHAQMPRRKRLRPTVRARGTLVVLRFCDTICAHDVNVRFEEINLYVRTCGERLLPALSYLGRYRSNLALRGSSMEE